jgi:hypothetical protein
VAFSINETAQRLRESLATLEWAVSIIPDKWHHELPGFYAEGEWGVAMNLAHLVVYEESIANPVLEALASGGDGVGSVKSADEGWFLQDALVSAGAPVGQLMERLRAARLRHIELVEGFDPGGFNTPITPLWSASRGPGGKHKWDGALLQPPGWLASKTFQHTWEHGNAVLRMALLAPR